MVDESRRAVCFVAMPLAGAASPAAAAPSIDFDLVFTHVERAVSAVGLDCVRVEFEVGAGFRASMYERLLIAEYVIADLSLLDPGVAYGIGVRHGAGGRPTILVGADGQLGAFDVDVHQVQVVPYPVTPTGTIDAAGGAEFERSLVHRLRRVVDGGSVDDLALVNVTRSQAGRLEHDKTDVFLERLRDAGDLGRQIAAALDMDTRESTLDELARIERVLDDQGERVAELDTALLGVFLAYRERKAYQEMLDLYSKMPPELRVTPVVREQLALAHNRLAEALDDDAESSETLAGEQQARDRATELRSTAIAILDEIEDDHITAETWAIRGRIYKAWFGAQEAIGDGHGADAMLTRAIDAYERGVAADLRDYFPGINAVTLRLVRAAPDDVEAVERLVPAVRAAVENAPRAASQEERYWQAATKVELDSATRNWEAAREHLVAALKIRAPDWMRETTAKNLAIHRRVFGGDDHAVRAIDALIEGLRTSSLDNASATSSEFCEDT